MEVFKTAAKIQKKSHPCKNLNNKIIFEAFFSNRGNKKTERGASQQRVPHKIHKNLTKNFRRCFPSIIRLIDYRLNALRLRKATTPQKISANAINGHMASPIGELSSVVVPPSVFVPNPFLGPPPGRLFE